MSELISIGEERSPAPQPTKTEVLIAQYFRFNDLTILPVHLPIMVQRKIRHACSAYF